MLLLLNKAARHGSAGGTLRGILEAAGVAVVEPSEDERKDSSAAIEAHAKDVDAVVVAGGDGSVNSAAAGLAATGLPAGIIPMGTANDLAKTLEIPLDAEAAVRMLLAGHKRPIDLGVANDKFFLNAASIGVSTRIARALHGRDKRRFGVLAYGIATLRVLTQARAFHAEIEADGATETVKAIQITVASGRRYGGFLTIHEDAEPDDGLLDLIAVRISHWWKLIPLTPALLRGHYGNRRSVLTRTTRNIVVRTRSRHDVDLDGDLLTTTPVTFSVRPAAIEIFVPPPAA